MKADVVVIGAGPAGSAAAYWLAKVGFDVVLIDAADFPRDKVCGDGVSPASVGVLESMGLGDLHPCVHEISTAVLVGPRGDSCRGVTGGTGWAVRRRDLDYRLVLHAQQAGARFLPHTAFAGRRRDRGRVTIETRQGLTIEAPCGVLATGSSRCALKAAGVPPGPRVPGAVGCQAYFEGFEGPADALAFSYERGLLPGYGWVIPLGDGTANVGVGSFRGPGGLPPARPMYRKFIEESPTARRLLKGAKQTAPERCWPMRMGFQSNGVVQGRLLLAGDAASCVNPLSGEGIYSALVSGKLAAEAVKRAMEGPGFEEALGSYAPELKRAFCAAFRGAAVAKASIRHAWVADRLARAAARHGDFADALCRVLAGAHGLLALATPRNVMALLA
jgi:geranylgeranyl reductase family protein